MIIETVLSPKLFYQVQDVESKVVVVIDVLRATSTITTILQNGAAAVIPVLTAELAEDFKQKGYLVGGERGGETIPGFDFGNSPFHYTADLVANKEVVLTTTNGTKCIEMARNAHTVVAGSFLNLNAVVDFIQKTDRDVVLFCAGWKDRVNLEDSLYAGAIASVLKGTKDDASILCCDSFKASKENLFEALKCSNHFQRLKSKGVVKDIEYCCQMSTSDVVPVLHEGKLVRHRSI